MSDYCESIYSFVGTQDDLARLQNLMEMANHADTLLAEICKSYFADVPTSEVQFNRSIVEYVMPSEDKLEIGICSSWTEPVGVFENLIKQLKLDSVKFCYYAIEPENHYAHAYAETAELKQQLPKYYFECYFPGDIWEGTIAYSLEDVTRLYNETIEELEEDEGVSGIVSCVSSAETEEELLKDIHNLNSVLQKRGYEHRCSLTRFTMDEDADE